MANKNLNKFMSIEILRQDAGYTYKDPDVNLIFVLSGKADLIIDNNTITLNKNDIYLINSQLIYKFKSFDSKDDILVAKFTISMNYISSFVKNKNVYFDCDSRNSNDDEFDEMRNTLRYILKDYSINGIDSPNPQQFSDYYKILNILTTKYLIANPELSISGGVIDRKKRIVDYLENNYANNVSLLELSKFMNLNEAYLSRYFKKTFGMTTTEYLYNIRLEHARNDLMYSNKSLTEITFDNGFPNVSTFDRRFKEKYNISPSNFKKEHLRMFKGKDEVDKEGVKEVLNEHLNIIGFDRESNESSKVKRIVCNYNKYSHFDNIWNVSVNIGDIESILNSDVQKAIIVAKQEIGFDYVRVNNIFTFEMFKEGENSVQSKQNYTKVFRAIDFLLSLNIKPIFEIGKQNKDKNQIVNAFKTYRDYVDAFEKLVIALIEHYDIKNMSAWAFEYFYDSKLCEEEYDYYVAFKELNLIIKKYIPHGFIMGSGLYLGEDKEIIKNELMKWKDNNVYPDFYSFRYYPKQNDEEELTNSIKETSLIIKSIELPHAKRIVISEFNVTNKETSIINDSLWKASYLVKTIINNLDSIKGISCSQLSDITTRKYDNPKIINGTEGLITRDLIKKPSYIALKLMQKLQNGVIDKGDGYIITRNEYGKITILCYNHIERNYLYYIKGENDNNIKDHYSYFADLKKKKIHFQIDNITKNSKFILHHHYINRNAGSIIDEWSKLNYMSNLKLDDIEFLTKITNSRINYTIENSIEHKLEFNVELEPFEIRCISIEVVK